MTSHKLCTRDAVFCLSCLQIDGWPLPYHRSAVAVRMQWRWVTQTTRVSVAGTWRQSEGPGKPPGSWHAFSTTCLCTGLPMHTLRNVQVPLKLNYELYGTICMEQLCTLSVSHNLENICILIVFFKNKNNCWVYMPLCNLLFVVGKCFFMSIKTYRHYNRWWS